MATTQGNLDMVDSEHAVNKIKAVSDALMKSEPDDIDLPFTDELSLEIADQLLPVDTMEMTNSHSDGMEPVYIDTLPDSANAAYIVNSEPAPDVEAMGTTEHVDHQQFLSNAVSSEQLDGEAVPSGSVLAYSFDHEEPSSMFNGETPHQTVELVKIELVHPQLMHTDDTGSDLIIHSESPGLDGMQLVTGDNKVDSETRPTKGRKGKRSVVWEHFQIESVSPVCKRAFCKQCGQSFAYSTGSRVVGTSHLKRHLAKGNCTPRITQQESNQIIITTSLPNSAEPKLATTVTARSRKRRYRSSSTPYLVLNQDQCRHEIARMIIMHEYPLHMVEHPGLVSFVQHLQPRFDMVNFSTVQGDCVATYMKEKTKLQKFIEKMPGRISLTLDVWTSNQTTGYVFLYGQFIDHEWKLQRRLLNVVLEPFPESDTALSHATATCLSYWNLNNKLHSVTFNQVVSDAARENLRGLLSVKSPSIVNGQLLIGSCLARTLSDMALDALAMGQGAVGKIRSSVKYVITSYAHEEKFLELKHQLQVPSEKSLVLDNVTRWDTTYHMLVSACELKEVFNCLDAFDSEYRDAPNTEDWNQAESVCVCLKFLLETANLLVSRFPPSADVFFQEVWKIQMELARVSVSLQERFSVSLQERFDEYWRESFVVLAIAVAMDPRFKMKLVEFRFSKVFGGEAAMYVGMVEEGVRELFREYAGDTTAMVSSVSSVIGLSDFDRYMMETTSQLARSELDQYLGESLLPRVQEFDVLEWWRLNKVKYPALSKMAIDVLSVPLSTVGPDHVFDTERKEMDEHRSLLRPETLEAVMCTKDWLQYEADSGSNQLVRG